MALLLFIHSDDVNMWLVHFQHPSFKEKFFACGFPEMFYGVVSHVMVD